MSAYEMLLSESQERMLMVLRRARSRCRGDIPQMGSRFAIIGRTTDDLRFVVKHKGEIKADLPIKELGDEAPLYDRPVPTPKKAVLMPRTSPRRTPIPMRCCALSAAPTCSKRWV